ncbi:MAG TPA: RsmD family RNA methyltransferase, partial [Vicinamibacterales bacterium]|nr:RsmD family RNA methyltransferase [Vicinamibacterales bacterium]
MRVIAGRLKGRRLQAPAGARVRPTSGSLRETLFNVLGPLDEMRVLDAFAGTGALGIEAYSRGAASITFIEQDPKALHVLRENVSHCGVEDACVIIRGDFMGARVDASRFDLVLLDPPYTMANILDVLTRAAALVAPGGRLVFEHSRRTGAPASVPGAARYRTITAG